MNKQVRVKPIKQPKPDMRKLARALLMLAEQQRERGLHKPRKRAS